MISPEVRLDAVRTILTGQQTEYYRILNVKEDATKDEAKKAYLQKLKLVHPDKNRDNVAQSSEAMLWLNGAYRAIVDPDFKGPGPDENIASWWPNAFEGGNNSEGSEDEDEGSGIANPKKDAPPLIAPEAVKKIYESVTTHFLKLVDEPSDDSSLTELEGAQRRIESYYDAEKVDRTKRCMIHTGLIMGVVTNAKILRDRLQSQPSNTKEHELYESYSAKLQDLARTYDWPKTWCLPSLKSILEGFSQTHHSQQAKGDKPYTSFYEKATPYVEFLKSDPENNDAKSKIKNVNEEVQAHRLHTTGMELDHDAIDVNGLCLRYKLAIPFLTRLKNDCNDIDAWRKAATLNEELTEFIVKHGYPLSWALEVPKMPEKPSEIGSSISGKGGMQNMPTTREGEPICGHRKWKMSREETRYAYLFAILPNRDVPIGELRSGSLIGASARKAYLDSDASNEVRKYAERDTDRWQSIEQVFVHPGSKHETWVRSMLADKSVTGELTNIERPLMTRTDYLKLRQGIDGDYDIKDLYEKYGQTPPPHILKRRTKVKQTQPQPQPQPQPHMIEAASDVEARRKTQDSTMADLESIIAQLRRQDLEEKQKAQESKELSEQEKKRFMLFILQNFPHMVNQQAVPS